MRLHLLQTKALEDREQLRACPLAMRAKHAGRTLGVTLAQLLQHRHMFFCRVHRCGSQPQCEHAGAVGTIPVIEYRVGELPIARQLNQPAVKILIGCGPRVEVVGF